MTAIHDVYVETGPKRVFAGSLQWPGWCRSGKTEQNALEQLVAYGPRYRTDLGSVATKLNPPTNVAELRIVEWLAGGSGTDFGVPSATPDYDRNDLEPSELEQVIRLLRAAWDRFDVVAEKAVGVNLRLGPRGGGRSLDKIVGHVYEAEAAYAYAMGSLANKRSSPLIAEDMENVRDTFIEVLTLLVNGEAPPRTPRRAPLWDHRYAIRRSVWHTLDHAWEIEDRSEP